MNGKKSTNEVGVKADGDYKLVVNVGQAASILQAVDGLPSRSCPQNQKTVEQYGSKYGTASKYMCYDGPFNLTEVDGYEPFLDL